MIFSEAFDGALSALNIDSDEFSELLIRLLDYGVINRDASQVEAKLYDRYLHCEELVEDYLSVLKVRLQHDSRFCFIRLFPPGSTVPGMLDVEEGPFNNGFRVKPSQQEVSTILVLRVEYEKSLREGQVDERGCVLIPLESIAISYQNLLKRSLPDSQGERKNMFKRLKQLRLIDFNSEFDLDTADNWISIQPSITSFVNAEVLTALYPAQPAEIMAESAEGETDVL